MTNEITKATIDLAPLGEGAGDIAEVLAVFSEEMDGLGSIPMPSVSTPSGGGLAFTIGEGDDAEVAKKIRGVIVHHHASNVYYEHSIEDSEGDTMPTCSSFDGKTGIVRGTGEVRDCSTCPFNQFGADNRKPCGNRHIVYILREGDILPTRINLPSTSLQNFKKFLVNSVVMKMRKSTDLVVEVSLERAESRSGQAFSRYKFTPCEPLTTEEVSKMRSYGESFKAYINERNAELSKRDTAVQGDIIEAEPAKIEDEYEPFDYPF